MSEQTQTFDRFIGYQISATRDGVRLVTQYLDVDMNLRVQDVYVTAGSTGDVVWTVTPVVERVVVEQAECDKECCQSHYSD